MKRELITETDPKSPISEVFRALRTNLQFMSKGDKCQTILITSTVQAEGKSWTAANLATTFAQSGYNTLLIDSDMRKPRQHKIFGTKNSPGLSNYLSGINELGRRQKIELENIIIPTEVESLSLIPAGNIPPNPSELLMSGKAEQLVDDTQNHFDVVIFDGAPCLLVTDSTIISRLVENTVLVTSYKYTKTDDLKECVRRIKRVGGNIAGVILNRVEISKKKYENKYYYANSSNMPVVTKKVNRSYENIEEKAQKLEKAEAEKLEKEIKDKENKIVEKRTENSKKNIDKYINDRVSDTEKQIKKEIESKKFATKREVPSDKAKEILESIKGYKE